MAAPRIKNEFVLQALTALDQVKKIKEPSHSRLKNLLDRFGQHMDIAMNTAYYMESLDQLRDYIAINRKAGLKPSKKDKMTLKELESVVNIHVYNAGEIDIVDAYVRRQISQGLILFIGDYNLMTPIAVLTDPTLFTPDKVNAFADLLLRLPQLPQNGEHAVASITDFVRTIKTEIARVYASSATYSGTSTIDTAPQI